MGIPRFLLAPGAVGDSDLQALFPGSLVPPVPSSLLPPFPYVEKLLPAPLTALNFENSARVPGSMLDVAFSCLLGSLSLQTHGGFNNADPSQDTQFSRDVIEPRLFSTSCLAGLTREKRTKNR